VTTKRSPVAEKKKRKTTSFEPDVDVAALLESATAMGITKSFAINYSLRKYLPKRLGVEATR